MTRKNFEKTTVSGSKIEARGVPERSGRAGSSGKTTKSGDKARSKQPDRADRGQIEPARASQVVRLLAQVERGPSSVSVLRQFRYRYISVPAVTSYPPPIFFQMFQKLFEKFSENFS